MPNQAYNDKIDNYKSIVKEASECLPSDAKIVFEGEDDDYGIHLFINGIYFTIGSTECVQVRTTLLGIQRRTYEGWYAEIHDDEGNSFCDETLSEICTLENLICECYLWTVRHEFQNKSQAQGMYSDWVNSQGLKV